MLQSARFAADLARSAGRLDLGQAAVVSGRRTIALEDIAGTDALLKRVTTYRRLGLAADGMSPMVLAKVAKPDQPMFVDLPAIGPKTVANARRAGIAIIAVQAGATLMIERQKLVSRPTPRACRSWARRLAMPEPLRLFLPVSLRATVWGPISSAGWSRRAARLSPASADR